MQAAQAHSTAAPAATVIATAAATSRPALRQYPAISGRCLAMHQEMQHCGPERTAGTALSSTSLFTSG